LTTQLNDVAAERAVVAGVILYGHETYVDVSDIITNRTFTLNSNEIIYRCVEHIVKDDPNAKPDVPSIMSAAKTLGLDKIFEDREELKHLRAIMNTQVRPESVRKLAGKICKLEVARTLKDQVDAAGESLLSISGEEPISHILGLVENPIIDFTSLLTDTTSKGIVPMGANALEYVDFLMDNPRDIMGIPTGFDLWDESVGGGLRKGCFDIWASRQKTGKSFAAVNIALNIVTGGKRKFTPLPVLYVDLEMEQEEHQIRILANLANLKSRNIEKGYYANDTANRPKLREAAKRLADLPYDYLCARGMPFEDIIAFMRRWIIRKVGLEKDGKANPCVIIYDWLKLTSPDQLNGNLKEYQLLGFTTSGLKNFMGKYGTSCVCFSQLNRDGIEYEDTRVIRGADSILDFCTSFTLFKRKTDDEIGEQLGDSVRYTHKLITLISRFGPAMSHPDYINIATDYEYGRITEGPTAKGMRNGFKKPTGEFVTDGDSPEADGIPFTAD
jgi:replicative DNA helicase